MLNTAILDGLGHAFILHYPSFAALKYEIYFPCQDFKPREKVERVRNCTKIGADIIDTIVRTVVKVKRVS